MLTSFCHHLVAYWLFPAFAPFLPCLSPVRWRLSCNAHCLASRDISQCSQAEVAQRVPERKPKIGLPIYLSAAIDPFTGSAWTYSTRIHPQNKRRRKERQICSLSLSVSCLCFGGEVIWKWTSWWARLNCGIRYAVVLLLSNTVRGWCFSGRKGQTQKAYKLLATFVFFTLPRKK